MASTYATIRSSIKPLTPEQLNAFLSEDRNAVLATINKNGTPQCTPVAFYWDGAAFYISFNKEAVKYKNLKRDPRMTLTVADDDLKTFRAVIAKGQARIEEQDIWEMTGKIIEKGFGPEASAVLEEIKQENRVLLILKPKQLQSWGR